jgi:hypothetical protein
VVSTLFIALSDVMARRATACTADFQMLHSVKIDCVPRLWGALLFIVEVAIKEILKGSTCGQIKGELDLLALLVGCAF